MKTFLHVGCGTLTKNDIRPMGFKGPEWQEIRLDIDPNVNPDVIGTSTNMASVSTASVDALFSSHNIEHLYAREVPVALAEFRRVLRPDGFAIIYCPDLQTAAELIAQDKLLDPAYNSRGGPISALDMVYGHSDMVYGGGNINPFQAHKTGFTKSALRKYLTEAGFGSADGLRGPFELWMVATVTAVSLEGLTQFARDYFPASDLYR